MKASDYVVEYLISREIGDVFGYPGGMVTHLMDSFDQYRDRITPHLMYHEQGAALAACGYAQTSGKVGVAYATSGPGATNLLTGICNAYFDSIPTLFITGQVNTFESKDGTQLRQRGFQETDIVAIASSVTKYAVKVGSAVELKRALPEAFHYAESGRKGPVLLDIPMNVFREEMPDEERPDRPNAESIFGMNAKQIYETLKPLLAASKKPVVLVGNAAKSAGLRGTLTNVLQRLGVPAVTSMVAVDAVTDDAVNYGFIGAYGNRAANFIVSKCDLLISLGARLDVRQTGAKRADFAPGAKIVRIDIDPNELDYSIRGMQNDVRMLADVSNAVQALEKIAVEWGNAKRFDAWIKVCDYIREVLRNMDDLLPNRLMGGLGGLIPEEALITVDVGQNQVWAAQSLHPKHHNEMLFSGGFGAMGYSLPAAVGSAIASGKPVFSIMGDGGIQMNLQELMAVAREKLPVKIVLFNNHALGMIRHFQEMYFDRRYVQTTEKSGYAAPDFEALARAYAIRYRRVETVEEMALIDAEIWRDPSPALIEVALNEETYAFPKLQFGRPNQDQEPLLDRDLYDQLIHVNLDNVEEFMTRKKFGGGYTP